MMIKAGNTLIAVDQVKLVKFSDDLSWAAILDRDGNSYRAHGNDAIEAVMLLKPSALEGKRLRWVKNAWAFHNLVGHPVMQILAWLRLYKAAIRFHDWTTPAPRQ